MLRIHSRAVLAGVLCAVAAAMAGVSIADATTTPPEDTSGGTPGSSVAESIGSSEADTTGAAATELGGMEILPPDEPWGGATRGEWNARLWQREASFSADADLELALSETEGCGLGQFGPVFFLENAGVGKTCVVAEGTAIFVVVADVNCSTVEPPPFFGRDEEELRACATAVADEITDSRASINGDEVADMDAYRTASPLFTLTFPENNTWGVEPGVAHAVSESYSFIIAPPPPGEYELILSTMYPGAPEPATSTINLIVQAAQVFEPPPSSGPASSGTVESSSPSSETTEAVDAPVPDTSAATETTGAAETTSPA